MLATPADDANSIVDADVDEPVELAITKDNETTWISSIRNLAYNKTDSSMRVPFASYVVFVRIQPISYLNN